MSKLKAVGRLRAYRNKRTTERHRSHHYHYTMELDPARDIVVEASLYRGLGGRYQYCILPSSKTRVGKF